MFNAFPTNYNAIKYRRIALEYRNQLIVLYDKIVIKGLYIKSYT